MTSDLLAMLLRPWSELDLLLLRVTWRSLSLMRVSLSLLTISKGVRPGISPSLVGLVAAKLPSIELFKAAVAALVSTLKSPISLG